MAFVRVVLAFLVCSFPVLPALSQEKSADHRARLLLDAEAGTQTSLGYKFPSTGFGPSIEVPVAKHFEFQADALYSPDRKAITNDGQSLNVSGSAIRFATQRLGFIASLERNWLWTSQFDKSAWFPSTGIVIRNDYFGPGRAYLTYVFPTGCVWATPSNPCQIQSNRLQGIQLRHDLRAALHMRWGFETGLYHFCDQANPSAPQLGRRCHWAATALATLRFEFHLGGRPRLPRDRAAESDNF